MVGASAASEAVSVSLYRMHVYDELCYRWWRANFFKQWWRADSSTRVCDLDERRRRELETVEPSDLDDTPVGSVVSVAAGLLRRWTRLYLVYQEWGHIVGSRHAPWR